LNKRCSWVIEEISPLAIVLSARS